MMPKATRLLSLAILVVAVTVPALATSKSGIRVEVLIDGEPVPEYRLAGITYVEALKGKEYAIRLTNPLPVRVAAALSVDGLNTIDARHTDAWTASKWVLGPHETITIQGWQTGSSQARRFFFTTEENSYGAWLGKTANLGVISAVFFREKSRAEECRITKMESEETKAAAPSATQSESSEVRAKDEYAATGIGDRFQNRVHRVFLELERQPCASFSLRYEFRPVLTRLGVLPRPRPVLDPMERRRHAQGFAGMNFCPDPK